MEEVFGEREKSMDDFQVLKIIYHNVPFTKVFNVETPHLSQIFPCLLLELSLGEDLSNSICQGIQCRNTAWMGIYS